MRYIFGIDLGTTNSCVSYVDTQDSRLSIQTLKIPQLISSGHVEARSTLPSFCYLSGIQEWPIGSLALPWKKQEQNFVGFFAQMHGAKVPTRLIQSAKSWLCHSAINRKDKILPLEADKDHKLSPLEATCLYLTHIRDAWNHLFAKSQNDSEFEQQEIILTVPASFDEVARRLTVEAAKMAGYVHLTLLEEPQAAFYSWISLHEHVWEQKMKAGEIILVCDVGGGTTDFSLIEVEKTENKLGFSRKEVGDHLLLGGDNMDAAIAHLLEEKLAQQHGKRDLQTSQCLQIRHQARSAKEALLSESSEETFTVTLQGIGSTVIKGSVSSTISREEITNLLLRGFFGQHAWNDALQLRKSTGFRTMGLPYEEEPSITKHLAAFLKRSRLAKAPEYILFNGGVMKPSLFQKAIIQSLEQWFPNNTIEVLESISLDLAVARGAAYYGKVRRGFGTQISGGIPKAFYLGIDRTNARGDKSYQALTLMPRGSTEGATFEHSTIFTLRPNMPVSFNLYNSHIRLNDKHGDFIDVDLKELQPLPAIHTILRLGKKHTENIPVKLHSKLTAIGTLELWLQSQTTEHRWLLEFQLRSVSGMENPIADLNKARQDEIFDDTFLQDAKEYLKNIYASDSKPEKMMEALEGLLNQPRREWSLSILRSLFDVFITTSIHRKRNTDIEARWWNLVGFFLRPGFGYPLDDFRIKELWKIILEDFKNSKCLECQIQQWICYRRIAGGLNKGQQTQLANEILITVFPNKSTKINLKAKSDVYPYMEKIRALASFERLEVPLKIKMGKALLCRILEGEGNSCDYWALGRIGARHLMYGSAINVIPREECSVWIESLLTLPVNDHLAHLLAQLARNTDHRENNIAQALIEKIIFHFVTTPYDERLQSLLTQNAPLTLHEQEHIFGEKLPAGLMLENGNQ